MSFDSGIISVKLTHYCIVHAAWHIGTQSSTVLVNVFKLTFDVEKKFNKKPKKNQFTDSKYQMDLYKTEKKQKKINKRNDKKRPFVIAD